MRRDVLTLVVAVSASMVLLALTPARAAEIVIEDSRCAQIKPEDLAGLEKKLIEAKAIAADDKLVCKAGSTTSITEKNMSLTSILPALAAAACQIRNVMTRSDCAKETDTAKRDACRDAESKRYAAVRASCN